MNVYKEFEVQGAGFVRVGSNPYSRTGDAKGVHFSCSWGRAGVEYGGVMDRVEMERLRDHLDDMLKMPKRPARIKPPKSNKE